jgi:hypothetical protein
MHYSRDKIKRLREQKRKIMAILRNHDKNYVMMRNLLYLYIDANILTIKEICNENNWTEQTVYNWLAPGRKNKKPSFKSLMQLSVTLNFDYEMTDALMECYFTDMNKWMTAIKKNEEIFG